MNPEIETYPESWDAQEKAENEAKIELKIKDGQSVRLKIINGPLPYRECYVDLPGKDNKPTKKRFTFPFGTSLPNLKLKPKFVYEVVLLDGASKGMHKVWDVGVSINGQLQTVANAWKSVRIPDIVFSRKGSGMNDTEYNAQGVPSEDLGASYVPELVLSKHVQYSTEEQLKLLGLAASKAEPSKAKHASKEQQDYIANLREKKGVKIGELDTIAERKFGLKEWGQVNYAQASELIDLLKAMP